MQPAAVAVSRAGVLYVVHPHRGVPSARRELVRYGVAAAAIWASPAMVARLGLVTSPPQPSTCW